MKIETRLKKNFLSQKGNCSQNVSLQDSNYELIIFYPKYQAGSEESIGLRVGKKSIRTEISLTPILASIKLPIQ